MLTESALPDESIRLIGEVAWKLSLDIDLESLMEWNMDIYTQCFNY